jgi:hypothetical protein
MLRPLETICMAMPPPIRPTFDHTLSTSVEETIQALRDAFEAERERPFQVVGKHVVVTVPPTARHFWSPYLTMEAQPQGSGTLLHGRFSPKPTIWTGFMLAYIALTTSGCFGLMFAGSLMMIGRSPLLATVLGIAFLLAAVGMYAASQVGQRLAREQMVELHGLICGALGIVAADTGASETATPGTHSQEDLPGSTG